MEAELFLISHPPYFNYLRSFTRNLPNIIGGSEVGVYVLSTQTSNRERKSLDEIIKNSGSNVNFSATSEKMTIGCARNIVAQKGKKKWAVFLDADVTLDRNYLKNLDSFLTKNPKADAIAGGIGISHSSRFGAYEGLMDLMIYLKNLTLTFPNEYQEIMSRLDIDALIKNLRIDKFNQSIVRELRSYEGVQTIALQGFNQIIKRETFVSVGGFDEKMWSAEDREMAIRLTTFGKKIIFAPDVMALHNYDFKLKDILKRKRIHGTWYGELRRKFPEDKRLRMSYSRWGRNLLKSFNPPYPFNVNMNGRVYYLFSFLNYASSALLSERFAINSIKNNKGGWIYGRDK